MRQTNRESWKYIGLPGYFPKPITCKAKTADRNAGAGAGRAAYETAGLVVNPTVHKGVFNGDKAAKALDLWRDFNADFVQRKGSGYSVNMDAKAKHFGCVQYKGDYLYSDYDLYDIIVVGHENANLALIGERDGVPNFTTARQNRIEQFVNERIGGRDGPSWRAVSVLRAYERYGRGLRAVGRDGCRAGGGVVCKALSQAKGARADGRLCGHGEVRVAERQVECAIKASCQSGFGVSSGMKE